MIMIDDDQVMLAAIFSKCNTSIMINYLFTYDDYNLKT
jgi:hypothetical protein